MCQPQEFMDRVKVMLGNFNEFLFGENSKLTKEQIKRISLFQGDVMGVVGEMAVQMGILEGQVKGLDAAVKTLSAQKCVQTGAPDMCEMISEIEERVDRSKNLILYNVPEPVVASREASLSADLSMVSSTIHGMIDQEIDIRRVTRIGKKSERPRPIKVELRDKSDALLVLTNSRSAPSGIKVKNDLTWHQRNRIGELRKELEERLQQGEKNITIRYINANPKIVSTTPKHLKNGTDIIRV
jgi:hypothetical protein